MLKERYSWLTLTGVFTVCADWLPATMCDTAIFIPLLRCGSEWWYHFNTKKHGSWCCLQWGFLTQASPGIAQVKIWSIAVIAYEHSTVK